MRILHLIHQYLPEKVGGTELYTRTLAQHQVGQSHSAAIFTPVSLPASAHMNLPQPEVEAGVRVYRVGVGTRTATAVFLSTFRQQQVRCTFTTVLSHEQPDIIHIQHLMGLPVALVNDIVGSRIPFVVTLHDYWHLCANAQLVTNYDGTICQGPKWWLNCARCALARVGHPQALPLVPALVPLFAYRQALLRRILAQASALIAPTTFTRQIHQQMGIPPEKVHVVPHGIDIPPTLPPRIASSGGLHLAYIGGLAWQKGVHILIAAVNQLPPDVKLSIIGDTAAFPDYVASLQNLAQHPGIRFVGRLPHEQLWHTLAEVDVVVVPSLWYETASLIIQEAFAAGVPVVASALGALLERVNDGIDGLLVQPGSVDQLRDVLYQLWLEPNRLARLKTGIRPARTIQTHVREVMAVYKNALYSDPF